VGTNKRFYQWDSNAKEKITKSFWSRAKKKILRVWGSGGTGPWIQRGAMRGEKKKLVTDHFFDASEQSVN